MNFSKYLFCRLYWWNTKIIKEKDIPIFYSITGLSVFHGFSIIPLYSIIHIFITKSFSFGKIFGLKPFLVIGIIVFLIDLFYFSRNKYAILLKEFEKIPKEQKKKKDMLCIAYIVSIIVINILFFIYFRSQNLGT
jgi:hypothetical protein